MASRLAPIECEVFHTDIFVASSVGGIQCVSSRAQGGNPLPWKMLLATSSTPNSTTSECGATPTSMPRMRGLKPKAKLVSTHSNSPRDMCQRPFMRSAISPFIKRERP